MDPITIQERQKYQKMWEFPEYRHNSPATHLSPIFKLGLTPFIKPGERLIDFGSGTGAIAPFLLSLGLELDLVDIARNALNPSIETLTRFMPLRFIESCLWELPSNLQPAEWILCIDVLEHIPENRIDQTLAAMAERTLRGGILQIYLEDEPFGSLIDAPLHLTIKSRDWWIEKINRYWKVRLFSPEKESCVRMIALVERGWCHG